MKKTLGVIIKVLLVTLIFFESFKAVTRFASLNQEINIFSAIFPVLVAISTAVIFIMFLVGKEKAPVIWYAICAINIYAILSGLHNITPDWLDLGLGMPVVMFYIYIGSHVVLAIVLGFYGWSLSQPSDSEKVAAKKKGKDFESFLKNQSNKH